MPEVPEIPCRRRSTGLTWVVVSGSAEDGRRRALGTRPLAAAVTLIELLCVMAIIGILMSLIATAAFKALRKAKQLAGELQAPSFQEELQRKYTPYRLSHPNHPMLDREGFIQACGLSSKAAVWLRSSEVRFIPFSGATPATTGVIEHTVKLIPNQAQTTVYSVMDLLLPDHQ